MRRALSFLLPAALLAAACSSDPSPGATGSPSRTDASDASDGEVADLDGSGADASDIPVTDIAVDTGGPVSCSPMSLQCAGARGRQQCNDTGDGWNPIADCPESEFCERGLCVSPCEVPGKFEGSTVACDFWSVDLGQWHVREEEGEFSLDPSVSVIPHAVLIGNPGERPATVSFEVTDGTEVPVDDPIVPPGEARSFLMPVLSQQDTAITEQAIHVVSTQPVIASQFNPASNAPGFALHSTDASLLYPTEMLGTYHVALSQPGVEGFAGSPAVYGYFTVVAVEDGTTRVTVTPSANTAAGPDIPAHEAGRPFVVELEQGQVFNTNVEPRGMMATTGGDLTGSVITSDKPVAVFGGHQCMVVVDGNCDHLESQLLPLERWGTRYLAVPFETPNPTSVYRVVSAQSGNTISTDPSVPGLDGVSLGAGEWVEVSTSQAFEVTGTLPFSVAQFMAGNSDGGAYLVDTSMTVLVPVSQFRRNYPLLIPADFAADRISITRPTGAEITLNGAPVSASFRTIGSSGFEVAHLIADDGVQVLESEQPFGVVSYGFDHKVSYAVPGGMGAEAR